MRRRLAQGSRLAARLVARIIRPPRTIRFTRDGVKFVAVALAIGVAAINTGNNLLYLVLAMMLSFIILSGLLSEVTLRGVSVTRELPATAIAHLPVAVRIGVTNGKRWAPSFSLAVHDLVGPPPGRSRQAARAAAEPRTYFLKISPGETSWGRYTVAFPRRGRVRFGGFRLTTRYPFGLFVKSGRQPGPGELIVLPPVEPVTAPWPEDSQSAGDRAVPRRGHGTALSGLREYRIGDEPRAVHWRRSAAFDDLVVREFDRDDRDRICIVLASRFPEQHLVRRGFEERFEAAVRRAASLAAHLVDRGCEVELRTGDARVPLGSGAMQRQAILTALALAEAGPAGVGRDGSPAAPVPPPPAGMLSLLVTPDPGLHAAADLALFRRVDAPAWSGGEP